MAKDNMERIVDVFHHAKSLKYNLRFTAVPEMEQKDSVASHMWRMSLMAVVLYHELELDVNLGYTLSIIQAHDIGEIEGDIDVALIIAGEVSKAEKDQIEADAVANLRGMLPEKSGNVIYALWEDYEKQNSREAKFVKALDSLEATLQIIEGGPKCIDYPDSIVFRPQKAVRNFPEVKEVYIAMMQRLRSMYEEGGFEWKPEYDAL